MTVRIKLGSPAKILLPVERVWFLTMPGGSPRLGMSCFLSQKAAEDACARVVKEVKRMRLSESAKSLSHLTVEFLISSHLVVERFDLDDGRVWWVVVDGLRPHRSE